MKTIKKNKDYTDSLAGILFETYKPIVLVCLIILLITLFIPAGSNGGNPSAMEETATTEIVAE